MLHIITALYRIENLENVYNSIFANDDITWHISKSKYTDDLNFDFIKKDKRIKLYNCDCDDTNTTIKRNNVLENISSGYFCFLDDDTIFHENMYIRYLEAMDLNFKGMLIGQQLYPDDKIRLIAMPPKQNSIDTGNVLCHTSCLKTCRWPENYLKGIIQKDFLFWNSVYNFYEQKCSVLNQPISYYNKLSKNDKWKKERKLSEIQNMKTKQKQKKN